jgi:prolyl oligopeptidase
MDGNLKIPIVNIQAVDPYGRNQFWLTSSGYTQPSTLFLADASKMDSVDKKVIHRTGPEGYIDRKLRALTSHFDPSDIEEEQKFVTSRDGTVVPYFIIHHKSLTLNKKNPMLLYGFGSFGVSICPQYSACTGVVWLEGGCVYVQAVVRGGGEFGDFWHETGKRDFRSLSLEDFIAVAEDLIDSNVCTSKTLGIRGGISGGLLIANAYIARPDLFGAVHCHSPLLDMKRYKDMGYCESWVQEFGDPDSNEWDEFMKKYSPYHNIDKYVKKYPPILFTTIANGPSLHPGHAWKFAKKLWDLGLGKKWPAFYFESSGEGSRPLEAKQYAYITVLAHDFLFRKLSRSK